jgi:Protein of unknown function (DUF4236)
MGLRFRKTFSILPGVKLNIGKKSASVRVGVKGLGFTAGTAGQTVSASLPGSGFSVSHKLKGRSAPARADAPAAKRGRPWVALVVVYVVAGLIWWTILHPK